MNALQEFLEARRAKFGDLQNLARLMGVTFSGFLRAVKAGTLSTDNCLRLAVAVGEDATAVLKIARKQDIADLIERLYGNGHASPLPASQREILELWTSLDEDARDSMRTILKALPREGGKAHQARGRSAGKKGT